MDAYKQINPSDELNREKNRTSLRIMNGLYPYHSNSEIRRVALAIGEVPKRNVRPYRTRNGGNHCSCGIASWELLWMIGLSVVYFGVLAIPVPILADLLIVHTPSSLG